MTWGKRVMLKHFSLDHKFIILDDLGREFEKVYRDDEGNLHIRTIESPGTSPGS